MMGNYRKTDIAHLKYKLINNEGLSVAEADKRIDELVAWMKKNKTKKQK